VDFDPNTLKMSLFSGHITIDDLELRPQAAQYCIEKLYAPLKALEVVKGTVSQL
jgi:hypothetical protein